VHAPGEGMGGLGNRPGTWSSAPLASFCHHALLYEGEPQYLELAADFVREGTRRGDQVLVLAAAAHLGALHAALGPLPSNVRLTDADPFGANPARVLHVWRDFLDSLGPDDRARGMAVPVAGASSADVAAERTIHELLLNLAFVESRPFWLVCPYDTSADDEPLEERLGLSHPFLMRGGEAVQASAVYRPP